ncbi:TetR/AcrR family transcriptional regulator [Kineococcus arenarius]|uniref:TetR/AcrR family transcriptional regulator n=1 Tax=Kineococcus sp. SYSU DK007 TaxID=3383128 RepID=UPI003D7ED232
MSPAPPGRPRSQDARQSVLRAIDDLLVERGYAGVTMKAIAERAGVSRQTLYRWWSTTAEILLEACVEDARDELRSAPQPDARQEVHEYLRRLEAFLLRCDAGAAYRALLGESQHDARVRELVRAADVLAPSAHDCLARVGAHLGTDLGTDEHVAELVGPVVYAVLSTGTAPEVPALAEHLVRAWTPPPRPRRSA